MPRNCCRLADKRHTEVDRAVHMIEQPDAAARADAGEIEHGLLLGQRVVEGEPAAFAEDVEPPLVEFAAEPCGDGRAAKLDRAEDRVVAERFGFEVTARRASPPPLNSSLSSSGSSATCPCTFAKAWKPAGRSWLCERSPRK